MHKHLFSIKDKLYFNKPHHIFTIDMPWKLRGPATPCSFLGKLQSFILRVEFPGFKSLSDYSVCEAKIAR